MPVSERMTGAELESALGNFTGTEGYTRWSILSRRHVATDGVLFLAENGGGGGAYWLLDAIASHHKNVMKAAIRDPRLLDIQFWTLKTDLKTKKCVLECWADTGKDERPAVVQRIEHTDFQLAEVKIWVQPLDETNYVLLLPSEY